MDKTVGILGGSGSLPSGFFTWSPYAHETFSTVFYAPLGSLNQNPLLQVGASSGGC